MNISNGCHRKNCATSKPKRNDKEIDNSLKGGEKESPHQYIYLETNKGKQTKVALRAKDSFAPANE